MSSRQKKQFLYGIFYFVFFGVILAVILFPYLKPEPSCFDGVRNGTEENIDCGGGCMPCYLKEAKPLFVSGEPQVFKSSSLGKAFVAVKIVNQNTDLGLHDFFYQIHFLDERGNEVGVVKGNGNIFPAEVKYFVEVFSGSDYDVGRIVEASFETIGELAWAKAVEFVMPNILVLEGPSLAVDEAQVEVRGVIVNESPFRVPSVNVVSFVLDKYKNPLFCGKTLVNNLGSFSTSTFSIYFPRNIFSTSGLEGAVAEVHLSVEE